MRLLETQPLERFNETEVEIPAVFNVALPDGRSIEYDELIANTPAVTTSYDGHNDPQLVIGKENGLRNWDESRFYPVGRLATFHGRNLEVLAERVEVADQYGNGYQSLCIKGSDLSDPHFFESATAERDYIIHGLQESLVVERVLRASKILRENGVDTEYICGLSLPKAFPIGSERFGIDIDERTGIDTKEPTLLPEFLEKLATRYAVENADPIGQNPLELKTEMIEKFSDCDYLITYRAIDCPYRLREINKFEEFKDFIKRNNQDPNVAEYIDNSYPLHLICEDSMPNLAQNLAKMHNLSLIHGFPHSGNISLMGSLIDLDSCRGEPLGLGDDPIKKEDEFRDLSQAFDAIYKSVRRIDYPGLSEMYEVQRKQDNSYYVSAIFLKEYLEARFEDLDQQTNFLSAFIVHQGESLSKNDDLLDYDIFFQIVNSAYNIMTNDVENSDTPPTPVKLQKSKLKMGRQDFGFGFSAVSGSYFRQKKTKILDPGWSMNEEYEELKDDERQCFNPVQLRIRGQVVREFISQNAKTFASSPNDLFFYMNSVYNRNKALTDEQKKASDRFVSRFRDLTESFVDRLSHGEKIDGLPEEIPPQAKKYMKRNNTRLAYVGNNEFPVFYCRNGKDYHDLFNALGIDSTTEIIFHTTEETEVDIDIDRGGKGLFIRESGIQQFVAESGDNRFVEQLIGYYENRVPMLIYRGGSKPQLKIFPTSEPQGVFSSNESRLQYLYDLVKKESPSDTSNYQLFTA